MPKPIEIDLNKIGTNPDLTDVIYGNKEVICKAFSLNKSTLTQWLSEMRSNPKFESGVLNVTHKVVLIHIGKFEDFCIWKSKNRYKQNKT